MKSAKKFICILTALLLVCAMALPAFAEGEPQYNEHDAAKLRAFFEQESPDGVKNGDVLFENYDPDDPATWDAYMEFADDDVHAVEWDENGRVWCLGLGLEDKTLYGTLDVSGMEELALLECGMCDITAVDCSGCAKLITVELSQNKIETIDLTGCTSIEVLDLGVNELKELDITDCKASLTNLDFDNNEIAGALDLTGMPNLQCVFASNNKLTSVKVPEECTGLRILAAGANEIAEAEIKADVRDIRLEANPLTVLDVTACPDFLELALYNCHLTELHMCPDGNPVDIVSNGHGTFGGYVLNNVYDHETDTLYDGLYLTGTPDEGYEYMGLYMDGELAFEPDVDYDFDDMPAMSLTAVFSGSEPAPSEPDPSEPAPIAPPVTGGASLVFLGVISIMGGAAAVCLRRRGN